MTIKEYLEQHDLKLKPGFLEAYGQENVFKVQEFKTYTRLYYTIFYYVIARPNKVQK